ncbi:hypothetical protein [Clostridium sp.]|uniref:hypothetical protein n=1 Tax=Clostridium sp. TaxID=1506 RepID=UPI002623E604|nr:hypothetical protein [Clostridium sp.]
MKINDIMGLNYAQFKKELKAIEICLNYHFKDRKISFDQLYWELNYILYGLDIHCDDYVELLADQGKYIFSEFQNFYFVKHRPCFVIIIEFTELKEIISNIKIRLLK